MATYLRGRRPGLPFACYNEVMTGFEYTAAAGMLYKGQTEAGLTIIQAIRDRYAANFIRFSFLLGIIWTLNARAVLPVPKGKVTLWFQK